MTREDLFEMWAPARSEWSAWAKPVLFAEMPSSALPSDSPSAIAAAQQAAQIAGAAQQQAQVPVAPPDASWAPDPSNETVVIVDLDSAASVHMGLALAKRGYRPIPVFNGNDGPSAVIDMTALRAALTSSAAELTRTDLVDGASPAFLIDARRQSPMASASPGKFDNRWLVFPQDFPSANRLLSKGIRRAAICHVGSTIAEDLAHVLLRWQEAGIAIERCSPPLTPSLMPVTVTKPKRFRSLWYRLLAIAGLRRHSAGGFGSVVPMPSSSGGHRGGFH